MGSGNQYFVILQPHAMAKDSVLLMELATVINHFLERIARLYVMSSLRVMIMVIAMMLGLANVMKDFTVTIAQGPKS
jgi:hypothetical protein